MISAALIWFAPLLAIIPVGIAGALGFGPAWLVAAFAFKGALPLPSWKSVREFFTHPVGIIVMVAALCAGAFLWGDLRGRRIERNACAVQIQASKDAAAAFDADQETKQNAIHAQQLQDANARVAAAQQEVANYAMDHKSCSIGAAGADFLNSLGGVRDGGLQPIGKAPAAGVRRRP
jgi:hypothetical protein